MLIALEIIGKKASEMLEERQDPAIRAIVER